MIKRIRELSLVLRIVLFVLTLCVWFFFLAMGEPETDPIKHSEGIRDNWIVLAVIIGGLWVLLFPKKTKTDVSDD